MPVLHIDLSDPCEHAGAVKIVEVRQPAPGCPECIAIGSGWVHLRECLSCGHIGCCDSSPNRHATKHFRATTHPIVASAEVGERWTWCYVDERFLSE